MDRESLLKLILTPHKLNRLAIEPSWRKGQFDSHAVDCPFPFFHEGRYWMTFVGWDGVGYRTGLASSTNLLEWKKEGLILDRGAKGTATEFNVALTSILRDNELFGPGTLTRVDGRFVGTYHAYPERGYEAGAAVIGICSSPDLHTWQVGAPVLWPDPTCAWEAGGLYKSWLMEHGGTYYLFYNAKDHTDGSWIEQTGFATSRNLIQWERHPGNPVLRVGAKGAFDERFASDPCVFRHGDAWIMFYFGLSGDGHARDSVAFSTDLVSWEKSNAVLVDVGGPDSVDSKHAHKAGMIARDGKLHHFYCAVAPAGGRKLGAIKHNEIRGISLARG